MSDQNLKIEWNDENKGINIPAKVTDGLLDLASPFTRSFRQVGNAIDLWGERRSIHYIAETLKQAREIAKFEGIEIEPKATKLISEWTRNVALEDDASLQEKWARLLLNSSSNFRSRDVIFANYLSRIGQGEAQALDCVWRRTVWSERTPNLTLLQEMSGVDATAPIPTKGYLPILDVKFPNLPYINPDRAGWESLAEDMSSGIQNLGCFVVGVTLYRSMEHNMHIEGYGSPMGRFTARSSDLQIPHDLEALGILQRYEFSMPQQIGRNPFEPRIEVEILAPSLLGLEFLKAISPPLNQNKEG